MSDILFKEGILIGIDSYENDGDNSQTRFISGLSEVDVRFYKELLEVVGINNCMDEDVLCEIVESILKKYPNLSHNTKEYWVLDSTELNGAYDIYLDLITDALGCSGDGYDYGFIRCFDGLKAYEVPRPIRELKI